jgi:hypothetical protein
MSTSWRRRFPHRRQKSRDSDSVRLAVYSPSLRWLRRTRRLPSRETRRRIPMQVTLYSDVCSSKNASTWLQFSRLFGTLKSSACMQQDDALSSLRRRLDYIAANSITPLRGAADCGEYRQAARAFGAKDLMSAGTSKRRARLCLGPFKSSVANECCKMCPTMGRA